MRLLQNSLNESSLLLFSQGSTPAGIQKTEMLVNKNDSFVINSNIFYGFSDCISFRPQRFTYRLGILTSGAGN